MQPVAGESPPDDGYTWTRLPADEFWSGPCTPFFFSWLGELCQRHAYDWANRRQGLDALLSYPGFRLYRSHVYWSADLMAAMYESMPPALRTDRLLAIFPPDERAAARDRPFDGRSAALAQARFSIRAPRYTIPMAPRTWDRLRRRFEPFYDEMRADPPPAGDADAILAAYAISWDYMCRTFHIASAAIAMHSTMLVTALSAAVGRWAQPAGVDGGDGDVDSLVARLLSGTDQNLTAQTSEGLRELAEIARGVPGLLSPPTMDALRARGADAQPFLRRLDEFLARHGHRAENRDVVYPRWHEDPSIVLVSVAGMVDAPPRALSDAVADAAAARTELLGRVTSAPRRAALARLLDTTRRFVELRDNGRYWGDRGFDTARQIVRQAGANIADRGVLDAAADVFFVTKEEMLGALQGFPKPGLAEAARDRRTRFEADRVCGRPPAWLRAGHAYDPPPTEAIDGVLTGLPASGGTARGVARVLASLDDADRLGPGDVLVADNTDPGWTPLFSLASAVVLEAGGLLAHGPIVAREYGLPCVVGIRGVTRAVPDGATVVVDGGAGTVTVERSR